ncbi:branched-chain amino acid ABC transporter permease [Metarhizobium album]|uniref:Branched-chain amino acid ABC transporter permease n=1 Tax=Metarhizobium album TaxID=2182425 RepID=A0A2U2DJ82_9HYPH|nr:branched-chain amino acid ABC transporter permease [Rhizobium album]PWE53364.1 branched-chain amino acid ABC transporter permease [Rhizobium album]
MTLRQILILLAVAACILLLLPGLGRYSAYIVYVVAIASIGALALNLLIGYCGQISFAHGGLLGVGAYAAGNFGNAGQDMVVALAGAGFVTALISVMIGLPALRLRGLYFAIATLAAQFILEYLFRLLEPLTHGVSGLLIEPAPFLGFGVSTDRGYAAVSIILLVLSLIGVSRLLRTDLGRRFILIRDSEMVARGMGINVARTKFWAFAISGFLAGIAGGLLAFTTRIAAPEAFEIALSVDYVAMIIVGGLGSLPGAVIGAFFVVLLPEVVQRLGEYFNAATQTSAIREMIFGLLIILFMIYEPRGLNSLASRLWRRWRGAGTKPAKTPSGAMDLRPSSEPAE